MRNWPSGNKYSCIWKCIWRHPCTEAPPTAGQGHRDSRLLHREACDKIHTENQPTCACLPVSHGHHIVSAVVTCNYMCVHKYRLPTYSACPARVRTLWRRILSAYCPSQKSWLSESNASVLVARSNVSLQCKMSSDNTANIVNTVGISWSKHNVVRKAVKLGPPFFFTKLISHCEMLRGIANIMWTQHVAMLASGLDRTKTGCWFCYTIWLINI